MLHSRGPDCLVSIRLIAGMGRKRGGQRGFMKSLKGSNNQEEGDDDEASDPVSPSNKPTGVEEVGEEEVKPTDVGRDAQDVAAPTSSSLPETKSQLRERHKQEQQALKKQTAQMGKKKKAEAAALIKEMKEKHEEELQAFDKLHAEKTDDEDHYVVNESLPQGLIEDKSVVSDSMKQSKAQKRRDKAAKKVAERDARVAEEQADMGESAKITEEKSLNDKLAPLGLRVHDIKADGHCLYRALDHQLNGSMDNSESYKILRRTAADYLRDKKEDFLPFFVDESGNEPDEAYSIHCDNVENTAEWGGELELRALSQALSKTIIVHSVDLPDTILGDQPESLNPLRVCFMRHAYGLGDHYSSVEDVGID